MVEKALVRGFPVDQAIDAYLGGCWDWSRTAFSGADDAGRPTDPDFSVADPGFSVADAADALLASVEGREDLRARWRDAEQLTNDRFDDALAVLSPAEREEFAAGLAALA